MTSRRLSDLDMLAGLADNDILYVVRPGEPIEDRSRQIVVQNAREYLAGMVVRDVQVTALGNIRVIGNAADGSPVDVTLAVPGTTMPVQEIHYALGTTWSTTNSRLEGNRGFGDVDDITRGNVLVFNVPLDRPSETTPATLSVSGITTVFAIRDSGGNAIAIGELTPGRLYWGVVDTVGLLLMNIIGEPDIVRTAQHFLSNAELKTLNTNYIELVAAPGAGKYIEVQQAWLQKHGVDPGPDTTQIYRGAVSVDTTLTSAEILAGTDGRSTRIRLPIYVGDAYLFGGFNTYLRGPANPRLLNARGQVVAGVAFEEVPGTVMVAGIPFKFWRTTDSVAADSGSGGVFQLDGQTPGVMTLAAGTLSLTSPYDISTTLPLTLRQGVSPVAYRISSLLLADDGDVSASTTRGQTLIENRPLWIGYVPGSTGNAQWYNAATYDLLFADVNDVEFGMTVRYQIHDIQTPPPGP